MKKKYIFIIILVFVLAVIGLFIFIMNNKDDKNKEYSIYDFNVEMKDGISYVNNEKIGLSFAIPKGWKAVEDLMSSFSIRTENFIPFNSNISSNSIPKNGCWIGTSAIFEEEGSEEDVHYSITKYYINNPNEKKNNQEIIEIDGTKGLKERLISEKGETVMIWVPINNIVYLFQTSLFGEDKESCQEEFNKFLDTISIKK
ncbi:MAG: hypothetical protein WC909_03450 [Candidatus Paceibacterota bacterium]|jgi:hypothetical protein